MGVDAVAAIGGMAVVLYATRVAGFWVVGRFAPSSRVRSGLQRLAGVTLVALTAPAILGRGGPEAIAAVAVAIVAARTGNVLLSMLVGVGVVVVVR